MRVGNFCGGDNIVERSVVNSEGNILEERCVEQNSLLIYVSYERAKRVQIGILDVHAVNQNLADARVVIAWNEVDERRFSRARSSHYDGEIAVVKLHIDI